MFSGRRQGEHRQCGNSLWRLRRCWLAPWARRGAEMTFDQSRHQAGGAHRRRTGRQRLRLFRRQCLAGAELVGRAQGNQELRPQRLRSRRADRQRLLALGDVRHPRQPRHHCRRTPAIRRASLAPAGAIQGKNDAGVQGYFGPCPPKGDKPHHYQFQIFAVDVDKLDADASASPAAVDSNLRAPHARQGDAYGALEPLTAGGGSSADRGAPTARAAIGFSGQASSNSAAAPSAANGFSTTGAGCGASGSRRR